MRLALLKKLVLVQPLLKNASYKASSGGWQGVLELLRHAAAAEPLNAPRCGRESNPGLISCCIVVAGTREKTVPASPVSPRESSWAK